MDSEAEYAAAVAMHNHYSSVRAAIISFAAPVQVTITAFSIEGPGNDNFENSMLVFSMIFFLSIYVVWQFFSTRLRVVKLFLLRRESGAGEKDRLFTVIYQPDGNGIEGRSMSFLPRELVDFIIIIFGFVTVGTSFLSRTSVSNFIFSLF